jgi:energy-converting hydrogenase B subunit Q
MGIPVIRTASPANSVFEEGSTSENCDRTCEPVTRVLHRFAGFRYSPRMTHALLTTVSERPGMLHAVTKVLADHSADIKYVDIRRGEQQSEIYLEFTLPAETVDAVVTDLRRVEGVAEAAETPTFNYIYGKRIIVIGGGAQVGMVAMGAIAEADRHNIRGERISVDTIPLVGEQELAAAVRATARLPRVKLLVLAGSIMGGEITRAVEDVRRNGLPVISLNMAGSVPDAADLVVSDPVQAGVMAVMAVADTAKFDLMRQVKKRY